MWAATRTGGNSEREAVSNVQPARGINSCRHPGVATPCDLSLLARHAASAEARDLLGGGCCSAARLGAI